MRGAPAHGRGGKAQRERRDGDACANRLGQVAVARVHGGSKDAGEAGLAIMLMVGRRAAGLVAWGEDAGFLALLAERRAIERARALRMDRTLRDKE